MSRMSRIRLSDGLLFDENGSSKMIRMARCMEDVSMKNRF